LGRTSSNDDSLGKVQSSDMYLKRF
jgi:hypothetical protein